jgi:uncharacterized protein
MHFALFAIGLLWLLASRSGAASAAQGISRVIRADVLAPLLNQFFLLILLVTGYTALHWLATRNGSIRSTNALPWRPTVAREWQTGAAFGWAMLLLILLPMVVAGDLHPQFWSSVEAWGQAILSLAVLLLGALATEIAWRGFLFRRLLETTGPVTATIALSLLYAFVMTSPRSGTPFSFFVAFAAGLLFSVAYLRTHGLWLGWGIRFGWLASMGVLFGLPLAGSADFASVVATDSSGRLWLTGGAYGPEGSVFTGLVLLLGLVALYPLTRDYAWLYTHPAITPGGYPVEVAPPAAHTAMEAAAGTKLVQILGTTATATPASMGPVSSTPLPSAIPGGHTQEISIAEARGNVESSDRGEGQDQGE